MLTVFGKFSQFFLFLYFSEIKMQEANNFSFFWKFAETRGQSDTMYLNNVSDAVLFYVFRRKKSFFFSNFQQRVSIIIFFQENFFSLKRTIYILSFFFQFYIVSFSQTFPRAVNSTRTGYFRNIIISFFQPIPSAAILGDIIIFSKLQCHIIILFFPTFHFCTSLWGSKSHIIISFSQTFGYQGLNFSSFAFYVEWRCQIWSFDLFLQFLTATCSFWFFKIFTQMHLIQIFFMFFYFSEIFRRFRLYFFFIIRPSNGSF